MAYSNSEQIFIDVLGRPPEESEWKQIHALLSSAAKTGLVVNDPSNAIHVVWLAWAWARGLGRADVLPLLRLTLWDAQKGLDAIRKDVGESINGFRETLVALTEKSAAQSSSAIDVKQLAAALAPLIQTPAQVTQHYDVGDSVKDALHKTFKWTWIAGAIAIGLLVSVFWTRMYIQDTRQIADLTAANAAQAQQLKDLQAQPNQRPEHRRP